MFWTAVYRHVFRLFASQRTFSKLALPLVTRGTRNGLGGLKYMILGRYSNLERFQAQFLEDVRILSAENRGNSAAD